MRPVNAINNSSYVCQLCQLCTGSARRYESSKHVLQGLQMSWVIFEFMNSETPVMNNKCENTTCLCENVILIFDVSVSRCVIYQGKSLFRGLSLLILMGNVTAMVVRQ